MSPWFKPGEAQGKQRNAVLVRKLTIEGTPGKHKTGSKLDMSEVFESARRMLDRLIKRRLSGVKAHVPEGLR